MASRPESGPSFRISNDNTGQHSTGWINLLFKSPFYINRDVSDQYFKTDVQYRLAFGPEINAGTGIFRFQVVYQIGSANVYSNNVGSGTNQSVGVSLGYQF